MLPSIIYGKNLSLRPSKDVTFDGRAELIRYHFVHNSMKALRGESKYDFRTVSVQWTLRFDPPTPPPLSVHPEFADSLYDLSISLNYEKKCNCNP